MQGGALDIDQPLLVSVIAHMIQEVTEGYLPLFCLLSYSLDLVPQPQTN
jgi:hypothetical protein